MSDTRHMAVRTYNSQVRVGNWNEDVCLREDEIKDFLDKKEAGLLTIDVSHNLIKLNLASASLSTSLDGSLKYGDNIALKCDATNALLATESTNFELTTCPVKNLPESGATARTAFKVVPVPFSRRKAHIGDTLTYGAEFCLVSNLNGDDQPMYLTSERVSFTSYAKHSRNQQMGMTDTADANCIFRAQSHDPQTRLELSGTPIHTFPTKVVINHIMTNRNLTSNDKYSCTTHFGAEYEVSCWILLGTHREELAPNHWYVVTKESEETALA